MLIEFILSFFIVSLRRWHQKKLARILFHRLIFHEIFCFLVLFRFVSKIFYCRNSISYLSKGMDPNWRHIIPPGHEKVISEGHCVDDCTRKSFPPQGISIFAVIMQTHNIGKEVKLRQVW